MEVEKVVEKPSLRPLVNEHKVEEQLSEALVKPKARENRVVDQEGYQSVKVDVFGFDKESGHAVFVALDNTGVVNGWQIDLLDVQVKNV